MSLSWRLFLFLLPLALGEDLAAHLISPLRVGFGSTADADPCAVGWHCKSDTPFAPMMAPQLTTKTTPTAQTTSISFFTNSLFSSAIQLPLKKKKAPSLLIPEQHVQNRDGVHETRPYIRSAPQVSIHPGTRLTHTGTRCNPRSGWGGHSATRITRTRRGGS